MRNLIPHFIHEQFQRRVYSGSFRAATLFVDISGFSSLVKAMLQNGEDGAQELTATLQALFRPLVHQVYSRGGLIPLFAGDGFTAIFHKPDARPGAPLQALHTAFAIQHFLSPQGQDRVFTTRYGNFSLGVRIGLSFGRVQWGIPGDAGRYTFYFRGPAVDGCARAQRQAGQGEIVADGAILPLITAHVTAGPTADPAYRRLVACAPEPAVLSPDASAGQPSLSRSVLARFVPSAVLDLPARDAGAEFRRACPAFISFEEPQDPALLHDFAATVLRLTGQYGGTFSQIDFGDKGGLLVLAFGAPEALENSVERAAECLLALQGQDWPIRWRAGMAFGPAWLGFRGGDERCEYGIVGDVVNLAARLAITAPWGQVWASAAASEHLDPRYVLEAQGTFKFKGRPAGIEVRRLVGKQPWSEPFNPDG
jgi:class 3 adenylate cyclase